MTKINTRLEKITEDIPSVDLSKLYDELNTKVRYLSMLADEGVMPTTIRDIYYTLSKASKVEYALGKDICEFNKSEADTLMKFLRPASVSSVAKFASELTSYQDFCINVARRVDTNINYFRKSYSGQEALKFINSRRFDSMYITEEELKDILLHVIDVQDKLMLSLMFYLPIEWNHLIDIERDDIDYNNSTIYIKSLNRTYSYPESLTVLMKEAFVTDNYLSSDGEKDSPIRKKFEDHLFNATRGKATVLVFRGRYHAIKKVAGIAMLTPTNIYRSGILKKLNSMYESITKEDKTITLEKFTKPMYMKEVSDLCIDLGVVEPDWDKKDKKEYAKMHAFQATILKLFITYRKSKIN